MSPFFSAFLTASTVASSARPAAALEISAESAMASINSDLFTCYPLHSSGTGKPCGRFYSNPQNLVSSGFPGHCQKNPATGAGFRRVVRKYLVFKRRGGGTVFFRHGNCRRVGFGFILQRLGYMFQRQLKNLVYPLDRVNIELVLDVVRNLGQILDVFLRDQHRLDAAAMRRQEFLLQTADRQYFAPQRDFPGHGDVSPHRNSGKDRHHRSADCDTGGRTVYRCRPFRQVDVDVALLVEDFLNPQFAGTRTLHGQRSLNRLLHHFAKLAGRGHLATPRQRNRLDGQQFTAHLGPGQPRHQPHQVVHHRNTETEAPDAEVFLQIARSDRDLAALFLQQQGLDGLAADLGDFTLQAAYTGFARVVAHDIADGRLGNGEFAFLDAVDLQLFGHQIALGDVDLLVLGISRQTDHFHAVEQGRRQIERVGRGDEHHVGQVVFDLDVMILKGVVLLGVEHLQQRRRRIAAETLAHLVDLVVLEQGILHAFLGQALLDLPRLLAYAGQDPAK